MQTRDVVYLLDVNGTPIRALENDENTQAEHVAKSQGSFKTTVDFDSDIKTEMQIIWRGERYVISDLVHERNDGRLVTNIEANIAYMSLSNPIVKSNIVRSPMSAIVNFLLEGTRWKPGKINDDLAGQHRLRLEDESLSVLAILRQLENQTEDKVKLVFDTINYTVNFLPAEDLDVGFLFTYGRNTESVTASITEPQATRIVPIGRDGLTIHDMTTGKVNYIENFDYYLSRGLTIEEAKRDFTKIATFKDERFTTLEGLYKEGIRRLNILSKPQVSYSTNIAIVDQPISVGMTGYVQDEELDIRVAVEAVRIIEKKDTRDNEIEFNFLKPNLADAFSSLGGGSGGYGGMTIVYDRLDEENFIADVNDYQMMLEIGFTSRSMTDIAGGINVQVTPETEGVVFDGYLTLDDEATGHKIIQTLNQPHSIGYPFVIPDVDEGPYYLRLMVKSGSGNFTVNVGDAEMYIMSDSLVDEGDPVIPDVPDFPGDPDYPEYPEDPDDGDNEEPLFEVPTFDDITIYGNIHYDKILPAIGNSEGLIIDDIRSRDFDNYRIDDRGIDLDSTYSDTGGLAVRLFGTHEETDGIDYEVTVTFRNDNDERESTTFIITVLFDERTGLNPPAFEKLLAYKGIYYPEIIIKRLPYSEAWDEWQITSIDPEGVLGRTEGAELLYVEPSGGGNIRVSGIVQAGAPSFAAVVYVYMTHPTAGDSVTTVEMTFNPKPHDFEPGDPDYILKE